MKNFIAVCICVLILGLGYVSSETMLSPRDPVPISQKVAHSNHCSGCHGFDPTGASMVDKAGNDVSIFDDWQTSMMGLSSHDPFWRATVQHEIHAFPGHQAEIEASCLRCHAPLGSFNAHLNGLGYGYDTMLHDSLGLDGVSCGACHQQPANAPGGNFSGTFELDTNRILFGHYPNPFKGPMQIYVGFEPTFGEHMFESGMCGSCHTLITESLLPSGEPTGNYFVEQATYHEWLNSVYSLNGTSCQSCHIPFIEDSVVVASGLKSLKARHPYGLHQFYGANTTMLGLMKENQDFLQLPRPANSSAWDESIEYNRTSLSKAAVLSIQTPTITPEGDSLQFTVEVLNKSGHKLPSGYPSRMMWLEVIITSTNGVDTLFASGLMDNEGHIVERDHPFEPHHEIIRSEDQIQIYEMVMGDHSSSLTTKLNAAYAPLKDNRVLPRGFSHSHFSYDTVAIYGVETTDKDYYEHSQQGGDSIVFTIPFTFQPINIHTRLLYQPLPPRWMNDLFSADSIMEVNRFMQLFQPWKRSIEVIASQSLEDIFNTNSNGPIISQQFRLYPNPVTSNTLCVHTEYADPSTSSYTIQILDTQGRIVQREKYSECITLSTHNSGVYFIRIMSGNKIAFTQKFVRL